MNNIGAHVSISGGIINAPARAFDLGCETFQCFTRSPQGGPAPLLTPEIVGEFKSNMAKSGFKNFYIHTPYFINFASPNQKTRQYSIEVVRGELERGSLLGAKYIMTHLGSYNGQTLEQGIDNVISAVKQILEGYEGQTEFLLEIAAGTGSIIGDTFEEIGAITEAVKNLKGFGGVCFDTCHGFASGYDFRTPEGASKVLSEFDQRIGLEFLKLSHVNDSKCDVGEKKDRHEHIGRGLIGEQGLASLLNTDPFKNIDWLLETDDSDRVADVEALKRIRSQVSE
jgi:deoxyribonuclease-4